MAKKKIVIVYHSQEAGNTKAAAELLADGIREAGDFEVALYNTNDSRVNPEVLVGCAGVALGTPDYFSYPAGGLKMFMDDWLFAKRGGKKVEGMPVALFLTHGGGGKAKEPHESLGHHVGPQVGETLAIKGCPKGKDADACKALGRKLAEAAAKYTGK